MHAADDEYCADDQGDEPIAVGAVGTGRMLLGALAAWSGAEPGLRFVTDARTVVDLLTGRQRCDVVLLEIPPTESGRVVVDVRRLVAAGCAVLLLGPACRLGEVMPALEQGARGFVTKEHDLATLACAIREIAAGGTYVAAAQSSPHPRDTVRGRPRLSEQERKVLIAYASGLTMQAAARRAGVRQGTAKGYLERVKQKYRDAGWPVHTKLELAQAVGEVGFES